jgi:hypothetical protein
MGYRAAGSSVRASFPHHLSERQTAILSQCNETGKTGKHTVLLPPHGHLLGLHLDLLQASVDRLSLDHVVRSGV